jgi:peroxiredoxin family protein/TusA-related sulfurtransferase
VDASGLQCPGPILRLKEELAALGEGEALTITVTEPGFPTDVAAWCHSTGHRLVELHRDNGTCSATVRKNGADPAVAGERGKGSCEPKKKSMVVFSGDLDKALASFIIANGAAAMGSDVTMFFTFWGLNVLRKSEKVRVSKSLIERMFGWMMPRGADRLRLSKMNMAGLGAQMIKGIMRRKHVPSLPDLIAGAKRAGVRLVACSMSMDLMGIKREELIEGVEEAGVASYLDTAEAGTVNLFI